MQYLQMEQIINWEGAVRKIYGITLQEGEKVLDQLPDVCADAEKIARMVEKLNRYHVSGIHFREVVCDMVAAQ